MYSSFKTSGSSLIRCQYLLLHRRYGFIISFHEHNPSKQCYGQQCIRRQSATVRQQASSIEASEKKEENVEDWFKSLNELDASPTPKQNAAASKRVDDSSDWDTSASFYRPWTSQGSKRMSKTRTVFEENWNTSRPLRKTDLSNYNVLKLEMEGRRPKNPQNQVHAFRAASDHNPDRSFTLLFMLEYYDKIWSTKGLSDADALSLLNAVHNSKLAENVERISYLLDYSWILTAQPHHIIPRYVALSKYREDHDLPTLPLWLLLQILRASSLTRESVLQLASWITPRLASWNWNGDSAMILGLRLLRHTRQAVSPDLETITACFIAAVKLRFREQHQRDILVLSHWCNRFLSLLATPAWVNPFRTAPSQQAAQLDLLQFMQDYQPEIEVNREGYRALARVQLMHKKTASEREWAEAKALTWPPWEDRNRMGAFPAPASYHGQETRVMKVLNRMAESGYAPHRFEGAMKILTGWDTDRSPTIQVARVPPHVLKPWKAGTSVQGSSEGALLWSSRIEATRTIREAWAIFCSYTSRVEAEKQSQYVYHAMHKKLSSPAAPITSTRKCLPGDGLEVFPDPDLARDRVYIPQPIPTVQELVSKMLDNKITCSSNRVMAYLLSCERDIDTGLKLLKQCSNKSEFQTVLGEPHSASVSDVAIAMDSLPLSLNRAYVKLLVRPNVPKSRQLWPYRSSGYSDGAEFMRQCLLSCRRVHIFTWNAYLEGLSLHLQKSEDDRYRIPHPKVVRSISETLEHFRHNNLVSFPTLRIVSPIAIKNNIAVDQIKEMFINATMGVSSHAPPTWLNFCGGRVKHYYTLPTGDDIELMAWVLGSDRSPGSLDDILALLKWVCYHLDLFSGARITITKHNLAVFRLLLEDGWRRLGFDGDAGGTCLPHARENIQKLLNDPAIYPDDAAMSKYLAFTATRRQLVQTKLDQIILTAESNDEDSLPEGVLESCITRNVDSGVSTSVRKQYRK